MTESDLPFLEGCKMKFPLKSRPKEGESGVTAQLSLNIVVLTGLDPLDLRPVHVNEVDEASMTTKKQLFVLEHSV